MSRLTASFACLACVLSSSFLFACGAASDAADDATAEIQDATSQVDLAAGSFHGTWTDDTGESGIASFEAEQDGLSFVGTVTFEDNPCFHTATISGEIDETSLGVRAVLHFDDADVTYEASLEDGTSLDGSFVSLALDGACAARHGTLALTR